jgi:protein-disulfide isomerase
MRRMENTDLSQQTTEDTVTFKRSHFYSFLVVFAFTAGILVGYLVWGVLAPAQMAASPQPAVAQAQGQAPLAQVPVPTAEPTFTRYDIPTEGFPSLGPEDAKIVLVEFSDFQCPFCKRWHDEVYQALLAAYPGQIRLVYRNLPLISLHPEAMSSAIASLCANDQGAYWPFHEKLFSSELELGREAYVKYAADLELDGTAFGSCLDSGKFDDFIKQDMDFSLSLGVRSTPTFFVNGLAVVGAQPLDVFKQVIDKELAGEIPE